MAGRFCVAMRSWIAGSLSEKHIMIEICRLGAVGKFYEQGRFANNKPTLLS